jgi:outer membrane protein, heavy metal efflux system
MKNSSCTAIIAVTLFLVPIALRAQPEGKKSFEFRGTVQSVDASTQRLTVTNEPIPGWMGAMTMGYAVDDERVLGRVKAGDRIAARVYEGEMKLYDVQVVSAVTHAGMMRLDDFEQMALASNPTMAQAKANLEAAQALVRQAGLYPNPTAGYYGDQIRGGSFGGGEEGAFVSQTIVLGGKLGAARRVARMDANEAETASEVQRTRMVNNVRALFYQALAAQRMVEVRGNLARLAGDTVETARQLGNVGQADRPDVLQAEVEQQQAAVGLQVAERSRQACWRLLAAVVGKPELAMADLEGDLEAVPELNYEQAVASAVSESPEVKLAGQALERANAALDQARKAPIPDLQLTGILMQSYEPLQSTGKPTGLMGGAEVGVQLPIFDRNQGNIAAAKAGIESAKQDLARVKLEVGRNLAELFRGYDAARAIAQQYKTEMLPRAEQAYNLYRSNYQTMSGAYPQVLLSQRTLFQLQTDYIQALENAWQSAILIQGFGLTDGLAAPASYEMNQNGPRMISGSNPARF